MSHTNIISGDPLVSAIFEAVKDQQAGTIEKLQGIVRAAKIAEAYTHGSNACDIATAALVGAKATSAPLTP